MGLYVHILLGILVISNNFVWACDPTECRQLRERLETLENVVRELISIVASQKTGQELDGILELSASLDAPMNKTSPIVETNAEQNKNEVNRLKGALKCSLPNLLDIKHSDNNKTNPSGKIAATLGENNSLQIEWTPLSMDCVKFSSGVWIRVYESGQPSVDNYLAVPKKCLKRRGNASFSIALPSSASKLSGNSCHFDLNEVLIQCRVYTVEVVPNYQSLKGKSLSTEIFIPPSNDNSIDSRESLISVASNSSSLSLKWKDNSGCANRLTALHFKIFSDGEGNAENATMSLRIPRDCLRQPTEEIDLFSLSLSQYETCPVNWVPLDSCRSYKIEMKSEYSDTWTRAATFWETFTEIQEIPRTKCPRDEFLYAGSCYSNSYICDGNHQFDGYGYGYGRFNDERYCDSECYDGFRCGRQCVPTNLLCDGKEDCIDGSDESVAICYPFARNESCQQTTNYSGQITSLRKWVKTPKNVVLITVQENHTIWLNFNGYFNQGNHLLKIYDGPYLTSPILLSHNGTNKPDPIRSSFNNLYVEFPVAHSNKNFDVLLVYTSVEKEPSIPGCGGYVYGEGFVSSPNYFSDSDNVTECVWYVEAKENDSGIFLKRDSSSNDSENDEQSIMIVYDGWNTSGQVLYDSAISSNLQTSEILYSISNKLMIKFMRPLVTPNSTTDWNVKTISLHHENILGSKGKISSPNYPTAAYPNLIDYRWNIVTELGKKVQLLFAFFETQESFDFVYVYDGSTFNSPFLLLQSGLDSTPFTITSSSNEILVRFTSDDDINLPGFLAVYSTV